MIKKLFYLTFVAALFFACKGKEATDTTSATGTPQGFGEQITADGAIAYSELKSKLEGLDSVRAKVKGTVQAVCQKKGCWMNVNDATAATEMFVQFKDYGFFMPFDIAGREVVMDGYAYRSVTSVDDLRHFAEDEGKSKEEIAAITEPVEELKFMASGVVLLPSEKK